jgi:hypothetical protein
VKPKETIVAASLNALKDCARRAYVLMMKFMANNKNNDTIYEKVIWSKIPKNIREKYALVLERIAAEECNLEIGRCVGMWGAKCLLQSTWNFLNKKVLAEVSRGKFICHFLFLFSKFSDPHSANLFNV